MGLFVNRNEGVGAGLDLADPNSPLASYYLRAGDVLASVLIAAAFVVLSYAPLGHTDIWGHVKYGDAILSQRSFLSAEPFCPFTERDPVGLSQAWLSQVIFAAVYQLGASTGADAIQQLANGTDALRLLHASLVAARLILLYLAFRRLTRSAGVAVLGLTFILAISIGNLAVVRPQVVAELLFAGLLLTLTTPILSRGRVVMSVVLLVAWANAHGSFPIGFALLGAVAAGRAIQVAIDNHSLSALRRDTAFVRLVLAGIIGLAAVAVAYPEGPAIFASTWAMAQHPVVRAMDEWQPIYSAVAGWARGIYAICAVALLLGVTAGPREAVFSRLIPAVLFLGLPMLNQRGVIWLMTVTPWLAIPGVASLARRWRPGGWGSVPSFRKTLAAASVVGIAVLWSAQVQRLIDQKPGDLASLLSPGTPWREALAIRDPALVPESKLAKELRVSYPDHRFAGCIFPSETLGDFFMFEDSPPYPVYIFTHVHLFGEDHWRKVLAIRTASPGWRDIAAEAHINLICVEAETERHQALCKELRADPDWTVVTDEAGDKSKIDPRTRLFVALRKRPK